MIIELTAAAIGGSIIGFLGCAVLTAGKATENDADWHDMAADYADRAFEASRAHARCADALSTNQAKLEDVRALLETPRTIRKKDLWAIVGRGCAE